MCKESNVCVVIGQNIKLIRMRKGISAKEFAQKFGISVCDFKKREAGKISGFCIYDIPKISEILQIDSSEILKNVVYVDD